MILELIRKGDDIGDSLPRQFVAPSVNFDGTSLQTLIDWDNVQLSEPLLTATMSTEEVIACLDSPLQVPSTWQCHSQAMERVVRKVSETCLMVLGEKKREGWIRCADESRKYVKKPASKADYIPLFEIPLD